MMALLIGGTAFTVLASLAMLLKIYIEHIHRWCRARDERHKSTEADAQRPMDAGSVHGLQMVQAPSAQARNRAHVRFQVDGADDAVEVFDDTEFVSRRVSGHEPRS